MKIEDIQESLKNDSLSPPDLGEAYTQLAGWYSYYGEMIKKVRLDKPQKWLELKASKEKPYSDKHTDILWEREVEGQKEIALEWELKRIEKMMTAIKQRLYIENQASRNQY